jgi:uncharacterized protein YcbX
VEVDAEGWVEDDWAGTALQVGDAQLVPRARCERCTMVTRAQPGLDRDVDIYRAINRHHAGTLGMWTEVRMPGRITAGDIVELAS